jgi:hypothetical protein
MMMDETELSRPVFFMMDTRRCYSLRNVDFAIFLKSQYQKVTGSHIF